MAFACLCVLFAIPFCAWADDNFIYWQGETPPASGVPSAQWYFDPDSWVGGLYPRTHDPPATPPVNDIAVYQFDPDVTPTDNTWVVQLGAAGFPPDAMHTAARVHPGNWEFQFEQPGASGAPPIRVGKYTLTGYPGSAPNSFFVGDAPGVTNLRIEGNLPGTVELQTNATLIALGADTNATVTLSHANWNDDAAIIIGYDGTGSLSLDSGSQLTTGVISLGQGVNPGGHGELTISGRGLVSARYSHIASLAGATGDAIITGDDAEWENEEEVVVGYGGNGTLTILEGGVMRSVRGYVGLTPESQGHVVISGEGSRWTSSGEFVVGDGGQGTVEIESGGILSVEQRLHVGLTGQIHVEDFGGRVLVGPGPSDTGTGGAIEVFENGTFSGNGLVVANVVNHGIVSPGASAGWLTIDGDYHQDDGTLAIEIGGTGAGRRFDWLDVTGNAMLGGTLQVTLINGFSPAVGSSFRIVTATDGIDSNFTAFQLPNLTDGRMWSYPTNDLLGSSSFVLQVLRPDYDGNGTVDAADYVVWRKLLGQMGNGLAADGNGDKVVDADDYDVWRSLFGRTTIGGGPSISATVPEPGSILLLLVAVLTVVFRLRKR